MCNRYSIMMTTKAIQDDFHIDGDQGIPFTPKMNVSSGDKVPVIINQQKSMKGAMLGQAQSTAAIAIFNFGWRPRRGKGQGRITNVMAKSINHQPMFRKAIHAKRCLIPTNGFIQWSEAADSIPYFIYHRNRETPFMMAGIWEEWEGEKCGTKHSCFAIITTKANTFLQKIGQERSPVVFNKTDGKRWLSNELALREVTAMLRPFDPTDFNAYPLTSAIKTSYVEDKNLLTVIGKRITNEVRYRFSKKMELQGMGETAARKRRRREEFDLPND